MKVFDTECKLSQFADDTTIIVLRWLRIIRFKEFLSYLMLSLPYRAYMLVMRKLKLPGSALWKIRILFCL